MPIDKSAPLARKVEGKMSFEEGQKRIIGFNTFVVEDYV